MHTFARLLIGLPLGLLIALVPASPCLACSCVQQTAAEAFERADAVFTGVVLHDPKPVTDQSGPGEVRVSIEQTHKGGPLPPSVIVRTHLQGPACGIPFREGRRWTIFAKADGDRFATSSCQGTAQGSFDPDRGVVMHPGFTDPGAPRAATPVPLSDDTGTGTGPAVPLLAASLLGALALVAGRAVRRRRATGESSVRL